MKHIEKLIELADKRREDDQENALGALKDAARLIELLERDGRLSGLQLADFKKRVQTRVEEISNHLL